LRCTRVQVWHYDDHGRTGYAGFQGRAFASGSCRWAARSASGGSFKIDHPLDPENKYLYHSFVESPDMMNVYNGVAMTDEGVRDGSMPDGSRREPGLPHQLTVTTAPTPMTSCAKVAGRFEGNRFTRARQQRRREGPWQVTGIGSAFARDQHPNGRACRERAGCSCTAGPGFGEDRRVGRTPLDETPRQ
jgi:hypothetical protein